MFKVRFFFFFYIYLRHVYNKMYRIMVLWFLVSFSLFFLCCIRHLLWKMLTFFLFVDVESTAVFFKMYFFSGAVKRVCRRRSVIGVNHVTSVSPACSLWGVVWQRYSSLPCCTCFPQNDPVLGLYRFPLFFLHVSNSEEPQIPPLALF